MLGFARKILPPAPPADVLGIRVKHNPRARRMSLRADAKTGEIILVWPKRASLAAATRFVTEQQNWITQQQSKIVKPQTFAPGMHITIAGQLFELATATGRGTTHIDGNKIIVYGQPEFFHRRLRDFLKVEALRHLTSATLAKTSQLNIVPSEVRIADPKSRWGSCGSDGRIMYSWRLIMAPPHVIDYIVAHEVAHRIHMDHSQRFWRLCLNLCEQGGMARRWLKREGLELMRFA